MGRMGRCLTTLESPCFSRSVGGEVPFRFNRVQGGTTVAKREKITSDASAAQAQKSAAYFKKLLQGGHEHGSGHDTDAVREVDYKGHHIVIRTTYEITIDGKPFKSELGVTNDGHVHYHGMPAAGFDSAVDLMMSVIDNFPSEFRPGAVQDGPAHDEHEAHGGHTHRSRRQAAKPRTRRSR